jgi:uncharacterized iron-regulated membrane protein
MCGLGRYLLGLTWRPKQDEWYMDQMRTRQLWIKIHRYCGLATLLFLIIAAVTGCFLCFDKRIDAAINPDLFHRAASGPALPPALLVTRLEAVRPSLVVKSFPLNPAPSQNLQVKVGSTDPAAKLGYDEVFLDPGKGRVVGTRQAGPGWDRQHIVEGIFQFHSTLLAGTWGRWIMGVAAVGWLIGNFVGLYLTLPASRPFWRKWKKSWLISRRARFRRFMLELHNASGLWLLIGASVLAFTSVAMNFYDEAFTPLVEAVSPARPSPFDGPAIRASRPQKPIGFDAALATARVAAAADGLTWRPAAQSYVADPNLYGVTFTDNGVINYHWLGPVTYYVDGTSGRLLAPDDPYHDSAGRKLSRSLYPLHSGEVFGAIGIAIIFLLGLSTTEMCVTGAYTWWKKRRSRLAMDAAKQLARGAA